MRVRDDARSVWYSSMCLEGKQCLMDNGLQRGSERISHYNVRTTRGRQGMVEGPDKTGQHKWNSH